MVGGEGEQRDHFLVKDLPAFEFGLRNNGKTEYGQGWLCHKIELW